MSAHPHPNFNPLRPFHGEARFLAHVAECQVWAPTKMHKRGLRELAYIGSRLQRRYGASCSYPWAGTESYQRGTEQLEDYAKQLATDLGLYCYLQQDPRGVAVYVGFQPLNNLNYSTEGHAVFYDRENKA